MAGHRTSGLDLLRFGYGVMQDRRDQEEKDQVKKAYGWAAAFDPNDYLDNPEKGVKEIVSNLPGDVAYEQVDKFNQFVAKKQEELRKEQLLRNRNNILSTPQYGPLKEQYFTPQNPNPAATPAAIQDRLARGGFIDAGKAYADLTGKIKANTAKQEVSYELKQGGDGNWYQVPKTPGVNPVNTGLAGKQDSPLVEVLPNGVNPQSQQKGMNKFAETLAAKGAESFQALQDKADAAVEQQYALQSQRAFIEQGMDTGKLTPLLSGVAAYAKAFGVPDTMLGFLPDPAKAEGFNQASFDQLLKVLGAQKGPQTEGDAQRARKTFAQLGNTKQGNLFILDYLDSLAERQQFMADYVFDFMSQKGDNPRAYRLGVKEYRDWARKHPLVAVSQKHGMPITYSAYKKKAIASGIDPQKVDEEWQKFAGGK